MPSKTDPTKQTKGWPPERRKAQAERIRQLKPWLKSTGPKTKAGKARSSLNAFKHGKSKEKSFTPVKHILAEQRYNLMLLNIWLQNEVKKGALKQALIIDKISH